ncbi:MAG: hypothetical protein ABR608_05215, partial [Pseudonocardiaceae bacterium]
MTEPLADSKVDQAWTSDRELDLLVPLAESLQYWSGVYERWRHHELATARPAQAPLRRTELAAVDELRGVHFGQLAAASRRWRQVGAAAARLAEATGVAKAALAHGWRDAASQPMLQRFDELARGAQDCAARCAGLGLELEIALIGTVAPVITSAVEEILLRSRGLEHAGGCPSREIWEQRITELESGSPPNHRVWRAELDTLVVDYDAVVGLFRATLAEAGATVTRIYRAVRHAIASSDTAPFSADTAPFSADTAPFGAPGPATASPLHTPGLNAAGQNAPVDEDLSTEPAPASTMLASAGSAGAGEPCAGSSFAGSGGGSTDVIAATGTPEAGSAVLGSLGESRTTGPGGATLGSLSGEDTGHGGGGHGDSGAWGSSALAPMAGAVGAAGSDEPQRTGRHWT